MAERLNSNNQGQFALGSSGVQAFDVVGSQLGYGPGIMQEVANFEDLETIRRAYDLLGETYDERGFLGGIESETTAANKALIQQTIFNITNTKYKNAQELINLSGSGQDFYDLINIDAEGNVSAKAGITADYYLRNELAYEKERTRGMRTGWTFKGVAVAPSALSDIPTSTSNWRRPRTVAAGYDYNPDSDKGVLTVVFRDGTFYNYYDVPPSVWIEFHDSFSKGPMLNRKSKNGKQAIDGKLLSYKHGPADMGSLSVAAQQFLYKVARTIQIYNRESKARINAATKKPYNYKGAETRGAPQNTRVKRKRNLNRAAKQGGYNPNRNAGQRRTP